MGLRIANNVAAINAHNQLMATDSAMGKSLQKLSSGYKINTAADKPAGLVISEGLRAQISGMEQAIENSQRASNIIGTAEGALTEMNTLLKSMRTLAVEAASTGGMDEKQIAANQAEVDSAISTIDRIANSTKFAGKRLLNGSQGFLEDGANSVSANIADYTVRGAQFGSASTISASFVIASMASRATSAAAAIGATDTVIRITGKNGSEVFSFASGDTTGTMATAINALSENTGVILTNGNFTSVDYGSDAFVNVEALEGDTGNDAVMVRGSDVTGSINGARVDGSGLFANSASTYFSGTIELTTNAATGDTVTIDLQESGMKFQLGSDTNPNEQQTVGIDNMHSTNLGNQNFEDTTFSGYLSSIRSGQNHSLAADSDAAVKIIDAAIDDVSRVRAELGAFQKNTLESNINNLRVTTENLTASESRIRDVDFAKEMMEFTKSQILMQSGTSMMSQANSSSQMVLGLL